MIQQSRLKYVLKYLKNLYENLELNPLNYLHENWLKFLNSIRYEIYKFDSFWSLNFKQYKPIENFKDLITLLN